MPTVDRYCINERESEIMIHETVELTQDFSDLTLGKERNYLISNDGNKMLIFFSNNDSFEGSDNQVSIFEINFENNSKTKQPVMFGREELYEEKQLAKIFDQFDYFKETSLLMIRKEDQKFHRDLLLARLEQGKNIHHYENLLQASYPVIIYKNWYVLANNQYLNFISRKSLRLKSSIKFQFLI